LVCTRRGWSRRRRSARQRRRCASFSPVSPLPRVRTRVCWHARRRKSCVHRRACTGGQAARQRALAPHLRARVTGALARQRKHTRACACKRRALALLARGTRRSTRRAAHATRRTRLVARRGGADARVCCSPCFGCPHGAFFLFCCIVCLLHLGDAAAAPACAPTTTNMVRHVRASARAPPAAAGCRGACVFPLPAFRALAVLVCRLPARRRPARSARRVQITRALARLSALRSPPRPPGRCCRCRCACG
jgi:hypothetical protein